MQLKFKFGNLVILLLASLLVPAQGSADPIKVGMISGSATSWPLRVAQDKGFFKQEGADVEVLIEVEIGRASCRERV